MPQAGQPQGLPTLSQGEPVVPDLPRQGEVMPADGRTAPPRGDGTFDQQHQGYPQGGQQG